MTTFLFGGYLFVPAECYTPEKLFVATLQQLGASDFVRIFALHLRSQEVPINEVLPALRQGGGSAEVSIGGVDVMVVDSSAEQKPEHYSFVEMHIADSQISYIADKEGIDVEERMGDVETFVQRWLACCEATHTEFAYFSKGEIFTEPPYRDEMLAALQAQDLDMLLHNLAMDWLVYLGPALHTQAVQEALARAQQKDAFLRYVKQQVLDSGAVFLRTSRDASLGNEDEEF